MLVSPLDAALLLVVVGSLTAIFVSGGNSSSSRPRGQHTLPVAEVVRELKFVIADEDRATAAALQGIRSGNPHELVVAKDAVSSASKRLQKLIPGTEVGSAVHDDLTGAENKDETVTAQLRGNSGVRGDFEYALSDLRAARQFKEKALAALTVGEQPASGSVEVPFAQPTA